MRSGATYTDGVPLRSTGIALTLFIALICALRAQAIGAIDSSWLGGASGDAGLYIYFFRHHLRYLFEEPFFGLQSFYPYSHPLAWSDNFILPALIAKPFYELGVSENLLYNLILLFAHLALGYTLFRLVLLITKEFLAAVAAGMIGVSLGYLSHSLGHPQLQFLFFIPLGTELLLRSLRNPAPMGMYFGLLLLSCFLTTVYFAIFLALLPILFFLMLFFLMPTSGVIRIGARFVAGLIPSGLLLIPFLLPYIETRELFGARLMKEMFVFRASGLSYASAAPLSWLYGETRFWSHAEAHFFPGILVYGLSFFAAVSFAIQRKALFHMLLVLFFGISVFVLDAHGERILSRWVMYLFGLVGVVSLLQQRRNFSTEDSSPPLINVGICFLLLCTFVYGFLSLGPVDETGAYRYGLFEIAYHYIPGMNALRAISRAGVLVVVGVVALSGCGVAFFLQMRTVRAHSILCAAFIILIGITENLVVNYAVVERESMPNVLSTLAEIREKGGDGDVAVFLPIAEVQEGKATTESRNQFAIYNVNAMNWALDAGIRTVNGYSGQQTRIMKELPGRTQGFPDIESLHALAKISNLRYVILRSQAEELLSLLARVKSLGPDSGLELLAFHREADDTGFALFHFLGRTKLQRGESIRVPSFVGKGVSLFEVKVKLTKNSENQRDSEKIILQEVDHNFGQEGKVVFSVPRDGKWHTLKMFLPGARVKGLPYRVQVATESESSVFIEQAHWNKS